MLFTLIIFSLVFLSVLQIIEFILIKFEFIFPKYCPTFNTYLSSIETQIFMFFLRKKLVSDNLYNNIQKCVCV